MTTEQTAQQLELAAQILRTGHPWKSSPQAPDTDIYSALRNGFEIRPILATPPDGRPLHNPDNLTAEQVTIPEDLAQAIGAILHGIENGIAVNFTAETIAHLAESKPALGAQLDPLLNNEPAQVLHYISSLSPQAAKICEMPGAEDYIKQLQAEFGDDEPEAA